MDKKKIIMLAYIAAISQSFHSCGGDDKVITVPEPVSYVALAPGENLLSPTRVHETENNCEFPFGGDGGKNLFFIIKEKSTGFRNVYRKDQPLNLSVSQLTGGHCFHSAPSYCAVLQKVAFAGRLNEATLADIYLVNSIKGGALTQVTNTPDYEEDYPCFSKDGKVIVYQKRLRTASVKNTEIWLKNLQTNETTQLELGCHPTISPDGRKIAFIKYSNDNYVTCLFVVNIDGTNLTQLTDAGFGIVSRPCFSPDGGKIVFECSRPHKEDYDIYSIDINGNNLEQLTINNSYDGEPYWSNDGFIYFTSDRGGKAKHYQIWRFKKSGGTITTTSDTKTHTVQSGETITTIARKYGVTVRDIVKWNKLNTMTINAGMKLIVSQ